MRRLLPLLLALPLALPLAPAQAEAGATVADYWVDVGGEDAHGLLALPDGEPRGLVVVMRGYGHSAESHRGHLRHLAEQGFVAVAMDFRGSGFPLRAGADDTLAATRDLLAAHPGIEDVTLYSVSMGTAAASMVLAEGDGLYDLWVVNEGLSMLHETWTGATALSPSGNPTALRARQDIEDECGGAPAQAPACYVERSAALRAHEYGSLKGAVLAHGLNDGLVPYDQGRELVAALRAAGISSDFYTVAGCEPGGEGTSITGYTPLGGMGVAGHGTESDDSHCLTALSFALLDEVVNGRLVPSGQERVVDRHAGTLP